MVRGLATLLQVGVVLLLARRCLTSAELRAANLARAVVLVPGVALVPAALAVLGGAISRSAVERRLSKASRVLIRVR